MSTLFNLSLLLHFIALGIILGKRVNFFLNSKVAIGLYVYLFLFHFVLALTLAESHKFLDPRDKVPPKKPLPVIRQVRLQR